MKILLICPWVVSLAALRALLRDEPVSAEIVRVDFEAALRAALVHDLFAAAFYTPTPQLSEALVEHAIRVHAPKLALHCCDRIERVGEHLVQLARSARS